MDASKYTLVFQKLAEARDNALSSEPEDQAGIDPSWDELEDLREMALEIEEAAPPTFTTLS